MSHTSTAAEVGHVLVVLGSCWTAAWLVGDAARGWYVTRRVGNRVLRVLRWRPRATDRRSRCHRHGHLVTWDGYHESCRRCDVRPRPGSVLLDDVLHHPYPYS